MLAWCLLLPRFDSLRDNSSSSVLLCSPLILLMLVSIAEQSKAGTVYNRLNIGIADLNPAWGIDVCPRVSVLCCPVSVEALCQADPPAKESYQMSLYVDQEAH
jgi:hypothetical protein